MRHVKSVAFFIFVLTSFLFAGYEDGMVMFQRGDYEQAIVFFQEVVDQAPDQYQGHQMLGLCYLKLKQNDKALQSLKKAFSLNPSDANLALTLSNLYFAKKDFKAVADTLKGVKASSIQNSKVRFNVHYQRGLAYYQTGNHPAAAADFDEAIKIDKDKNALYYGGLAHYQNGDYTKASANLKTAIEAGVESDRAGYWYVQSLNQEARRKSGEAKVDAYKKAALEARKVAQSDPTYDTILLAGETMLGAKMLEDALQQFGKAKSVNPKDGYSYFYAGKALSLLGRYEESQKELTKAIELLPKAKQKNAFEQMAYNHHKLQQFDDAIKIYEQIGDAKMVQFEKDAKNKFQNNIKADKEMEEYERKMAEVDSEEAVP
ncbi:MAG TPA: tetratricopeptide repeat protein [Thermoanaerobaculia bacterium]|nr:tetratricopeptide repeat protein [Thermoanaerobaculia bacterium]HUM28907.1 tetratricopeptide repeat protein [Thermoanaerobaculia bacterium]HXK67160.1 tetratricopeptide repeat protein [Thermoanaerobaculia bacterium]